MRWAHSWLRQSVQAEPNTRPAGRPPQALEDIGLPAGPRASSPHLVRLGNLSSGVPGDLVASRGQSVAVGVRQLGVVMHLPVVPGIGAGCCELNARNMCVPSISVCGREPCQCASSQRGPVHSGRRPG